MTISQDNTRSEMRPPSKLFAEYLSRSISLAQLANLIWKGRALVASATVAGLLYGTYTVHKNGPSYAATIRIAPAESDSSLGNIQSANGLLAGLTGGAGSVALPKFTNFMIARASVGVAKELDRRYDMLCRIFSGDCDITTHKWAERTGFRETINLLLARLAGLPNPNGPRTAEDLADYLAGAVTTEENKNNSMVLVRYTHRNPAFAAEFLSAVIQCTNDYIRAQNREIQRRYVDYLSDSAAKTTNVVQRAAIDAVLLQEERQLMMTEVDVPYAAKVLDGPTIQPVNNALKQILIHGLLGSILGALATLILKLFPHRWNFR